MINPPIDNDYVQNLQEGLNESIKKPVKPKQKVYQSEDKPENRSYLTKDVKLDPFPIPEKEEKVDENAEKGYPDKGIEGGTPEAAATHKRILRKLKLARGGNEYDRQRSRYAAKVEATKAERLAKK
jgi:hypothetical protein